MRRMRVMLFTVFAGLAGWAGATGAGHLTGSIAPAAEVAPDVLMKAVTLDVIAIIRRDRDYQAGHAAKVAELLDTRILPHFDFARMTQIAVAHNWRVATPEQRHALTTEFRTLLVRTYSTALVNYRDHVIEYKPLWMAPGITEVTVRSSVRQPGDKRTNIDYVMEKTTAGWKVYDIKIAGVSVISTHRSAFGQTIRDGGMDRLIQSLSARNRQPDAEPRAQAQENGARPLLFIMYGFIPGAFRIGR